MDALDYKKMFNKKYNDRRNYNKEMYSKIHDRLCKLDLTYLMEIVEGNMVLPRNITDDYFRNRVLTNTISYNVFKDSKTEEIVIIYTFLNSIAYSTRVKTRNPYNLFEETLITRIDCKDNFQINKENLANIFYKLIYNNTSYFNDTNYVSYVDRVVHNKTIDELLKDSKLSSKLERLGIPSDEQENYLRSKVLSIFSVKSR